MSSIEMADILSSGVWANWLQTLAEQLLCLDTNLPSYVTDRMAENAPTITGIQKIILAQFCIFPSPHSLNSPVNSIQFTCYKSFEVWSVCVDRLVNDNISISQNLIDLSESYSTKIMEMYIWNNVHVIMLGYKSNNQTLFLLWAIITRKLNIKFTYKQASCGLFCKASLPEISWKTKWPFS